MNNIPEAIVAGHLCLDIIPRFFATGKTISEVLVPGKLLDVYNTMISTGGTISTGIALHKLGIDTTLIAKIGKDPFGESCLNILRSKAQGSDVLINNLIISKDLDTSYTFIINPLNIDRIFLHFSGANSTFTSNDVNFEKLKNSKVLHFGYPPLMLKMYENRGEECKKLFLKAKNLGITTSLDMAHPDPCSPAGEIDWRLFLQNVLPTVDVFQPSIDEILFMLERNIFNEIIKESYCHKSSECINIYLLRKVAQDLLDMGVAIVGIKLGEEGYYLKTTNSLKRLLNMGKLAPENPNLWLDIEIIQPCYNVKVVGTTGAGDCTIAGMLAALLKGLPPKESVCMAVANGAACVENLDATDGIVNWNLLRDRVNSGWKQRTSKFAVL